MTKRRIFLRSAAILFCVFMLLCAVVFPAEAAESIMSSLSLAVRRVVPSLFVFRHSPPSLRESDFYPRGQARQAIRAFARVHRSRALRIALRLSHKRRMCPCAMGKRRSGRRGNACRPSLLQ